MSTEIVPVDKDLEAVSLLLARSQEKRDPRVIADIRERADKVRKEIHQEHGVLSVVVDVIREVLNSE